MHCARAEDADVSQDGVAGTMQITIQWPSDSITSHPIGDRRQFVSLRRRHAIYDLYSARNARNGVVILNSANSGPSTAYYFHANVQATSQHNIYFRTLVRTFESNRPILFISNNSNIPVKVIGRHPDQ